MYMDRMLPHNIAIQLSKLEVTLCVEAGKVIILMIPAVH